MELKPSKDKQELKPKLDGMGRPVAPGDTKNPFAQIARGINPQGDRRRRPFADTLGATPPRDGPFSQSAADVAVMAPPKTRLKRKAEPGFPFMKGK